MNMQIDPNGVSALPCSQSRVVAGLMESDRQVSQHSKHRKKLIKRLAFISGEGEGHLTTFPWAMD
jgi:hypothetical protein